MVQTRPVIAQTVTYVEELPLQQKATVATLVVMSHQKESHVTSEKVFVSVLHMYVVYCVFYSCTTKFANII